MDVGPQFVLPLPLKKIEVGSLGGYTLGVHLTILKRARLHF
jgi:hypothetical protein